jgi:hypothetical protein
MIDVSSPVAVADADAEGGKQEGSVILSDTDTIAPSLWTY